MLTNLLKKTLFVKSDFISNPVDRHCPGTDQSQNTNLYALLSNKGRQGQL